MRVRDADRRRRVAPPARLRRGAESRSDVHRLGGNSRHHHRGLDAPAGPAEVSRRRVGRVSRLRCRRRCGARDLAGRTLSGELPPARSGRGGQRRRQPGRGGRAGAGVRVGRPSAGAVDEARARMLRRSWREDSRGRGEALAPTPRRRTRARPARGATRSSRRRTCGHAGRDGNGERHVRDRRSRGTDSPNFHAR